MERSCIYIQRNPLAIFYLYVEGVGHSIPHHPVAPNSVCELLVSECVQYITLFGLLVYTHCRAFGFSYIGGLQQSLSSPSFSILFRFFFFLFCQHFSLRYRRAKIVFCFFVLFFCFVFFFTFSYIFEIESQVFEIYTLFSSITWIDGFWYPKSIQHTHRIPSK